MEITLLIPGSPIWKGKSSGVGSFLVDPKRFMKLQNFVVLRNVLGSFQKSLDIGGSSSIWFLIA